MDVIIENEKNLECSGVYIIRNNVNNMVYIGRAKNVYKRAIQHRRQDEIWCC
jgi:predicted GIY-YIG superfamily endonuclease